jgi:hypothetical protein
VDNAQLRDVGTLRDHLVLREALAAAMNPDLESWLQTLELMKMYDRWFSQQELQRCRLRHRMNSGQAGAANGGGADADGERLPDGQSAGDASGDALDGAPGAGYGRAAGVSDPPERDACAEPQMREDRHHAGMIDYITGPLPKANWPSGRVSDAEEMAFTRQHYFDRLEWPALVAKLHQACRRA